MAIYEVVMKKSMVKWKDKGVAGVKKIVTEVVPYLAKIDNEVVREVWVKRLAKKLDVSKERVWNETEKVREGVVEKGSKKEEKEEEGEKMEKSKKLARQLLAMLMQEGVAKKGEIKRILVDLNIGEAEGKLLGKFLEEKVEKAEEWIKKLPKELREVAEEAYLIEIERGVEDMGMIGIAVELAREKLRGERKGLVEKLKKAEDSNEEKEVEKLSERLAWLDQKERSVLGYLV